MPKNKTDNFLNAIKKYAKEQKTAMRGEVRQLKTERLKEAEEAAKRESDRLVKEKLHESRNSKTAYLAAKTQEGQRKLFIERAAMVDEVFRLALERLQSFTQTEAYADKLTESAKAIADTFDGKFCVLYVNRRDISAVEALTPLFSGGAAVEADNTIQIGGVRGYCESMGMIADETLDSKLDAQREWFVENAALCVL